MGRARATRFMAWLAENKGLELSGYGDLWQWSVDDLPAFWAAVWEFFDVRSPTPYAAVLEGDAMPGARWFAGTRLNYAEHVLRGSERNAAGPALLAVDEDGGHREIGWTELRGQVGALAARLRARGVQPGDRVAAYLPNVPEAVVALLAVTSIGATWTICAPDFEAKSALDRFRQVEPVVLIGVDGYRFGGREVERLEALAELERELPSVRETILVRNLRPDADIPGGLGAVAFDEIVREHREPDFTRVDFDHPLWILFSSGTTGLPKGIVHGHGGIVLEHLKSLGLCLDVRAGDRWFFFASTSWMAWNYLVGSLMHGATAILYDGSPAHPSRDATWAIAESTGANILAMGAAYVASCRKAGVRPGAERDLSALRIVIATGSPLADDGWRWLHDQLGRRVRIDGMCGGTDVCTAFFGSSPLLDVRLGELSCRWLGVDARAYDAAGTPVVDAVGEFVVVKPMPSMPLGFWNDADGARFRDAYFARFPGVWRQGDWMTLDAAGRVKVLGRSDATLNRGGVRLGSAEIYAVVEALPEVAEALVVGVELPDGGYYMPLFVALDEGGALDEALSSRIVDAIRADLSPRHVPDDVVEVPEVPRTLTGKKLEVPVKRILQGAPREDVAETGGGSAGALDWFVDFARNRM